MEIWKEKCMLFLCNMQVMMNVSLEANADIVITKQAIIMNQNKERICHDLGT